MKPLTQKDLEAYATLNAGPQRWIRVQLDTGGLAAGAWTVATIAVGFGASGSMTGSIGRPGSSMNSTPRSAPIRLRPWSTMCTWPLATAVWLAV